MTVHNCQGITKKIKCRQNSSKIITASRTKRAQPKPVSRTQCKVIRHHAMHRDWALRENRGTKFKIPNDGQITLSNWIILVAQMQILVPVCKDAILGGSENYKIIATFTLKTSFLQGSLRATISVSSCYHCCIFTANALKVAQYTFSQRSKS